MEPDIAKKLTRWTQDLFDQELTNLKVSLREGLPVKEYRVQDATRQALVKALAILNIFSGEFDKHYADPSVMQCLEIIQNRNENEWAELPKNELLPRLMSGVGMLAADMGMPGEAESIFQILTLLEPENIHHWLGMAYTKLTSGSAHEALEVIHNKVLNMAPGNDLGLAFLALVYDSLNKTEEALAAASAVITANRVESAVILAREVQRSLCEPVVSDNI